MLDSKQNSGIVKCSHCNAILSSEQFEGHKCAPSKLRGQKTIEVVYFMDVSCNGKKLMTGRGIDGVLYTFEVVPRKPIPLIETLNRRKVTPFRTDEEGTEPEAVSSQSA